jgi:CYTH domain-containing protein
MIQIELEKTYLVRKLPENLKQFQSKEIYDIYIPAEYEHPIMRVRKNGNKFEITKKEQVRANDASEQREHTIELTDEEYRVLAELPGKKVRKTRYRYEEGETCGEIDVFLDDLKGLVLADFEFKTKAERDSFVMPDYCLAEVTEEEIFAGGMLCGKKYLDIESVLKKFGYTRII